MELGNRILNFYNFCFVEGFDSGICHCENNFHVTVSRDGNIYSYGEEKTLTKALDECLKDLKRVGF